MTKKLLSVFIFCFVALLSYYTYYFFQSPETIATFQAYTSSSHKIEKELIDLYHNEDTNIQKEAKDSIIEKALTVTGYEQWMEFIDYIDMNLYIDNILPQQSDQLILALNLSKDLAIIVIFDSIGSDYIYHNKIENILPISKIDFLSNSSQLNNMMLVYQTLDERFGSFFYEEFLQVYLFMEGKFENVWQKTLHYEEIYKEVWINPNAREDLWNRVLEETTIDFIVDDAIKINTITTLQKYTTHAKEYPDVHSFSLIHQDNYKRSYYWSDDFNTFVLGEVTKEIFLWDVALLRDMEKGRESLFGITNKNYKVITSKGEILYLSKNKFHPIFQSFLEE
ncbi:hypothetical protein [Natronincola ferrireducens]|uniref:Uncharacterized protein n=1 Tax=Natronincola ferrireducens TaxID=393762 RepID=A0A1G9BDH6_9FIRM|nr:hypothetical protein [Natronincola ferrireducens]SDK36895.1 hypothetical protein SAMN05660472_01129 [Natronincola ferrireducens]